ncbi:MAG TPA: hypothetical protein ENH33_07225 [Actinobacteria bacterium]|nr:hypothetical protein [Actinomycetota bacterium]
MALTAPSTSRGFEFDRYVNPDEVFMLPGDPGTTYVPGDVCDFTNGVLTPCAAGDSPLQRVVGGGPIVCPASGAYGFGVYGLDNGFFEGSSHDGMDVYIPCVPLQPPPGSAIHRCTFAKAGTGQDQTITAYTAGTPSVTLTTSPGANDDGNGGVIFVYAGTGLGQWNIIADYVHATKVATLHRKFETALDNTSQVLILTAATTDTVGIGFGSRINASDENTLNSADGGDDGEWALVMDAREVPTLMRALMLKVVNALDIA